MAAVPIYIPTHTHEREREGTLYLADNHRDILHLLADIITPLPPQSRNLLPFLLRCVALIPLQETVGIQREASKEVTYRRRFCARWKMPCADCRERSPETRRGGCDTGGWGDVCVCVLCEIVEDD